jgi:hypothetical protein
VVLGIEFGALWIVGKHSTTELHLQPLYFWDRCCYVVQAGLELSILLPQPSKCYNYKWDAPYQFQSEFLKAWLYIWSFLTQSLWGYWIPRHCFLRGSTHFQLCLCWIGWHGPQFFSGVWIKQLFSEKFSDLLDCFCPKKESILCCWACLFCFHWDFQVACVLPPFLTSLECLSSNSHCLPKYVSKVFCYI